jgi:UDP-glucose 4-epimerase
MFSCQASVIWKPSRVVVFGCHGFVARRFIELLSKEGTPCRSIGRDEVDLIEPSAASKLRQIIRPDDSIVVTSALTPENGRDRATFLKNVAMIDSLCRLLAEVSCAHVVYISSDSVYDSRRTDINEESCCESNDLYALSHIVREKLLSETCQRANVRLAIIRPCAIYGAGDTHNSYGPNRFMRTALWNGQITLFGQGEEQRDHIYIDDVTHVIQLCLRLGGAGVLNAATGTAMSFHEVAGKITAAIDHHVLIETAPRIIPISHRHFDTTTLKQAFPNFMLTPFETGIRESLAELSSNAANIPCRRPIGSAQ